jgi:hypothetical protein
VTFQDRVRVLRPFGFQPRQTAFLAIVALHGGYCLVRQFDAFAGRSHGQVAQDFFARLVRDRIATRCQYVRQRGFVYHVCASRLYRAIGEPDSRNRRSASPAIIARRLMVLDYLLTRRDREWVATEGDKVTLFTTRLGLTEYDLQRRRFKPGRRAPAVAPHCFHRLPTAIGSDDGRVELVFLAVDESGAGFRTFLMDHRHLFAQLTSFTVVVVCPPHLDGLRPCRRIFDQTFNAIQPGVADAPSLEELRWFFRVQKAIDLKDLEPVSIADLNRYREHHERLTTVPIERLYAAWKRAGEAGLALDPDGRFVAMTELRATLVTHELPFRYEQFGSFPGLA